MIKEGESKIELPDDLIEALVEIIWSDLIHGKPEKEPGDGGENAA